ncbi:DUF2863 family protein [Massilia sp. 9096]|uniref:DUF2863 family protein n=1 Tax=Massilia sp. 9096 TaxID=1500894 RepID=UPI00056483C0|nr:DUF2863 family protein [Massilia sp. 9096]
MPKNKRPAPRKSAQQAAEADHEGLAQNLVDLALEITEREDLDPPTLAAREQDVLTLVRRALRRKHDEALYGAIDIARFTDPDACRYLRDKIEEEAATLQVRIEGEADAEIDCFMIPLFVHSTGGLKPDEVFADDAAFEELGESLRQAGLASADTRVNLVRHLYDLDSIDRIHYSGLQEMLREAAASMRSKKLTAAPAIEASMRPWQDGDYEPEDQAMELRFLVGFSLKHTDDPFYRVPKDEAAADAYFEGRMARYRMWAGSIAPLLSRCLSSHPANLEINFLYQDLFYGAKDQALSELAMLATLSEVNGRIDELDREPDRLKAVVAPLDVGGHAVLRINFYPLDGGAPLATVDKPFDLAADLETELDDLCDALGTAGLDGVLVASGFDAHGEPEGAEPYLND